MGDLLARLQSALGDAYRIEREFGGGGMSRVFLAQETALKRQVVIKVLPPEMAAGVNVERFRREVELAASLQHPHIVPLLSAAASGDLLYYTMPLVEGESLRAKLARQGELPVSETIRVLADVADALAYAHAHGVVHRDIKPDNVLISGKHAVVTDFGVSKAVSASSGGSLTSLGVALGTPAYMAPEQAAADPHLDHRADLYALGILGYEMLTGRPPFTAATPQATLAAQVTQTPQPVTAQRPAVPGALNALVMRCLEKHPADRFQSAGDVLEALEQMVTPSGGITPTGSAPYDAVAAAAAARAHPLRVAGLFALTSVAVLGVVYFLMNQLGLPSWVMPWAIGLLAVGLPIMVTTGLIERRRALARTTGRAAAPRPGGLRGWLTWRKALGGGVAAFAALGLGAGGYAAMRVLGIGPVGTLVASGVLEKRDRLVLADFENRTTDSTLGPSLTEALRVDLAQSPVVRLLDGAAVAKALGRMGRKSGTALDVALARELAQREGAKAVVHGEIDPVGRSYVLSADLLSATDGTVLVTLRENAKDDGAIIEAVDRLSGRLRERIGESLRTIRASEALEHVTTGSLEALRKYSQAIKANDAAETDRAVALLGEAIALDTTFAMAYRKLAVVLSNSFAAPSRVAEAATKAFQHRDRLTPLERYLAEAYYYNVAEFDRAEVQTRALAQLTQDLAWQQGTAFTLSQLSLVRGKLAEAESHAHRAMTLSEQRRLPGAYIGGAVGLAMIDVLYRKAPEAGRRRVEDALRRYPLASIPAADRPYLSLAWLYAEAGRPDRARQLLAEFEAAVPEVLRRGQPFRHAAAAAVAFAGGKVQDAIKEYRAWYEEDSCAVCGLFELGRAYERAGERDSALAVYERAITTPGLFRLLEESATLGPTYKHLGELYEERGQLDKAREYYGRFVDLWKNADPELQGVVKEVKQRLARLAGERGK